MADDEKNETTEPEAEAATDVVSDTAEPVDEAPAADEAPDAGETVSAPEGPVAPAAEATEDAPAAEEAPGTPEAPAAAPKTKSRRHVPRSERRQRTKAVREKPKTRRPITRTEKPVSEPGRRQERRGVVVSDKADKTIVVKVDVIKSHPKYKKVVRRSHKFHAHDEQNAAGVGDVVRIVESRRLSKTKNWRLAEIVEKAR